MSNNIKSCLSAPAYCTISEAALNQAVARARQALKFSMPSGVGVPGFFERDVPNVLVGHFLDARMAMYPGSDDLPRGIYVRYDEAPDDKDGFPLYGAPGAHAFAKGSGSYWRLTARL